MGQPLADDLPAGAGEQETQVVGQGLTHAHLHR